MWTWKSLVSISVTACYEQASSVHVCNVWSVCEPGSPWSASLSLLAMNKPVHFMYVTFDQCVNLEVLGQHLCHCLLWTSQFTSCMWRLISVWIWKSLVSISVTACYEQASSLYVCNVYFYSYFKELQQCSACTDVWWTRSSRYGCRHNLPLWLDSAHVRSQLWSSPDSEAATWTGGWP